MKAADSLKRRYLYKLAANFLGAAVGAVTQALVPRGLGPGAYGDLNFLTNFFNQIASFLDMGTSTGFYTKLSQRPKEFHFVAFYLRFAGLLSLAVFGFSAVALYPPGRAFLWPGQQPRYVVMAAAMGALLWAVQVLNKMTDAYGLTVASETARILQKILGLALMAWLFSSSRLNLKNYFFYQYAILAFLGAAFLWTSERHGYPIMTADWKLPRARLAGYAQELYRYSHPLLTYALVGLLVGIFDRWLLQRCGGSVQQGFYGLSYQIGAICFLFTSAMTPLLMREFSLASAKKDSAEMASLFRKHVPLFYSIAAFFSCFIVLQVSHVIRFMGGTEYAGAGAAVAIMALYPIHQTYGQLSGSVFYATGQTRLYRDIGIFFMLLGLPLTYFLIAPKNIGGLDAGATGLAAKMVSLQFIAVNAQLFFNARFLGLRFWKYLCHQLVCVGTLLLAAYAASRSSNYFLPAMSHMAANFLLAGIFYTGFVAAAVYLVPAIFSLTREQLSSLGPGIVSAGEKL